MVNEKECYVPVNAYATGRILFKIDRERYLPLSPHFWAGLAGLPQVVTVSDGDRIIYHRNDAGVNIGEGQSFTGTIEKLTFDYQEPQLTSCEIGGKPFVFGHLPIHLQDKQMAIDLFFPNDQNQAHLAIIKTLKTLLLVKDWATLNHCINVAASAERLAILYGLSTEFSRDIRLATQLHDVGKLNVPGSILRKTSPTERQIMPKDELKVLRAHAAYGARLFSSLKKFWLYQVIAGNHHEDWSGTGYPSGLKGTDIPLAPRIVAFVDKFDAMRKKRPYREAMSHFEVVEKMKGKILSQLDPDIVNTFFENLEVIVGKESTLPSSNNSHKILFNV